jgi:hypothetical protein
MKFQREKLFIQDPNEEVPVYFLCLSEVEDSRSS